MYLSSISRCIPWKIVYAVPYICGYVGEIGNTDSFSVGSGFDSLATYHF